MKAMKWVLIGALFAIVFAGCYTKLVHPPVTDDTGTYYHPRKLCSDCHSSADYYYYHPYYYDRWNRGRYWGSYYNNPWWYRDYWWWDDDGESLPTGATRYWDERERPGTVPKLVPPAGGVKAKDDQVPTVPGASSGTEVKEKKQADDSGSQYYQPRTRPETPKEEPKEQKKEEEKAKEKQ